MTKTVLLVGTLDTKGAEYAWVRDAFLKQGLSVLTLDAGVVSGPRPLPVDVAADEVASAGGSSLEALQAGKDRAPALHAMSNGAAIFARRLCDAGRIHAVFGMGGSGGTTVATAAMRALPLGVPKLCVSTLASGNVAPYVGTSDILMMPAVTDIAGIHRLSRLLLSRAVGAVCGMLAVEPTAGVEDRKIVAATMFGNTTRCVDMCREKLAAAGYEVLVFHATGAGGRTMEKLIDEGFVDACLDITTTEWADELCGGVFSAGPDRLSAPGQRGIPHLIVPGCLDMVNFGAPDTVPQHYRDAGRLLHAWAPQVTLMRTNVEENRRLGEIFAEKTNTAHGPVAFLLPLRGVSVLDGDGQPFCDRASDGALFESLRKHRRPDISVHEIDANINDPAFAERAVELLLELIAQRGPTPPASSPRRGAV